MSLTICKKCPDEKQVERTNNCTLNFYGTQQARMSSDGLDKVLYYLQPKKQCLFMGVFAKVPFVIFVNVCQRVCRKKELSKLRASFSAASSKGRAFHLYN